MTSPFEAGSSSRNSQTETIANAIDKSPGIIDAQERPAASAPLRRRAPDCGGDDASRRESPAHEASAGSLSPAQVVRRHGGGRRFELPHRKGGNLRTRRAQR